MSGRDEALMVAAEEIEKDMIPLGITAIEDKLQECQRPSQTSRSLTSSCGCSQETKWRRLKTSALPATCTHSQTYSTE
jgi:hypothetical protein